MGLFRLLRVLITLFTGESVSELYAMLLNYWLFLASLSWRHPQPPSDVTIHSYVPNP